MNILPHKSWHVRTKKNIARVREDERKAAEEEKEIKRRAELAEQEAKINLLRQRSNVKRPNETETTSELPGNSSFEASEHVNFFKELEDGKYTSTKENADRTEEKKQEKEKYEKQIGYLTYLGQDTNEILRKRDWYEMLPDRTDKHNEDGSKVEVSLQSKLLHDPLTLMRKYMGTSSSSAVSTKTVEPEKKQPEVKKYESLLTESLKNYRLKRKKRKYSRSSSTSSKDTSPSKKRTKRSKSKKSKKKRKHTSYDSSESSDEELKRLKQQKLEVLRMERLNREKVEREKAENLLRKLRGETEPKQPQPEVKSYKQRYNSQFNPEIARQNQE